MRQLSAAFTLGLLCCQPAQAETVISIADPVIHRNDSAAPTPELVESLLLSCFSASPAVAVVERAELGTAMNEQSLRKGFSTPHKGFTLQFTGADYVITSSVAILEGDWLVILKANVPTTTQIAASYSGSVTPYSNGPLCRDVVNPFLKVLAKAKPTVPAPLAATSGGEANEASLLMQGIARSKSGDYAQAFPFFLQVIARNPDHADARYWLAVSYARAGLVEFAADEARECLKRFPAHNRHKELEALVKEANKP